MEKKINILALSVVLVLASFGTDLFAKSKESKSASHTIENSQKVWSVDSLVYKYMVYLYIREGFAMPYSTGPWSTDELRDMLDNFDGEFEDKTSKVLYNKIEEILNEKSRFTFADDFHATINGIFIPEFYIHSNPENFNKETDWNYDYEKRQQVLTAESEFWIGKNLYFYFAPGLGYAANTISDDIASSDYLYEKYFTSNIPFLSAVNLGAMNANFPQKSFMAFGNDHWNVSLGRDVLKWGNGDTGNLLLGGNSIYDTFIRFSSYYDVFKYTFITNFYPHNEDLTSSEGQNRPISGTRFFIGHSLNFRFFKDKFNFNFSEGVMYQNKNGLPDLRFYNPTMIYHNYFMRGNANSILWVDMDYAVLKGLNLNLQIAVDEFSVLGEPDSSSGANWRPNKLGFLFGAKYLLPLQNGILKISGEGVYTDPYLYLREAYNPENGTNGVSFYGHVREFSSLNGGEYIYFVKNCIGFKYGGNCITGNFVLDYDSLNKWKTSFNAFYMASGIKYSDLEDDYLVGKQPMSPSVVDAENSASSISGEVQHSLRLSLNGEYQFFDWLKVYALCDNWIIWNKNNQKKTAVYDFQLNTGAVIRF